VTRGGRDESWHFGAAAVWAAGGRGLVARVGDPEVAVFPRSAAKPFQVLPLLLAGGEARFGLDDADLALLCASHSGTPAHTARAESLLRRGGFTVADLICAPHPPYDAEAAARLAAAAEAPSALHNNCSGKHAGMLLACRLLGLPSAGYVAPDHPLQVQVREAIARCCGLAADHLPYGVDGCSLPAVCLPLAALARGYAALAAPDETELTAAERAAAGRAVAAMAATPDMVAGPGRFTTALITTTGGRVIGKEGAEGVYAAAVRGPAALGLAVKIADGAERCRDGVVLDLLRQLGALSAAELETLRPFHRPAVRDARGVQVGEVVADVELEEVA
jgi:L-asparaginase II